MKKSPLTTALIVVAILGASFAVYEKRLDAGVPGRVCFSGDVAMIGVSSGSCLERAGIQALLQKPVLRKTGKPVTLNLSPPDSITIKNPVKTCADYIQKIRQGWYALSQRDMDKESDFRARCGLLSALLRTRTARDSFVGERKGLEKLDWLPESLLPVISEASLSYTESPSGARERSVAEIVAARECTIRQARPDFLSLQYKQNDITIRELARADFNGDGLEDILVVLSAKPTGGTAGFSEVRGLTREKPKGLLETFDLDVH